MVNKYFITELGVEATYLELRIFSYLECEEKIRKITEILNFLNNNNFLTNLTMLYHSMMRAENIPEHQGVPSLTIDLRDEKFRFKYFDGSQTYWLYHSSDLFVALIQGRQNFTELINTYTPLTQLLQSFQDQYTDIVDITFQYNPAGFNVDVSYNIVFAEEAKKDHKTDIIIKEIYERINQLDNIDTLNFDIDYSFKKKCIACEKAKEHQNELNRKNNE